LFIYDATDREKVRAPRQNDAGIHPFDIYNKNPNCSEITYAMLFDAADSAAFSLSLNLSRRSNHLVR